MQSYISSIKIDVEIASSDDEKQITLRRRSGRENGNKFENWKPFQFHFIKFWYFIHLLGFSYKSWYVLKANLNVLSYLGICAKV